MLKLLASGKPFTYAHGCKVSMSEGGEGHIEGKCNPGLLCHYDRCVLEYAKTEPVS